MTPTPQAGDGTTLPVVYVLAATPWKASCFHSDRVQWHWQCPSCGYHCVAYWTEGANQETIAADARCLVCRRS